MTNHFHLMLRPDPGPSIRRILQSLTVAHTGRYHMWYRSSGHVCQGRFKGPVIPDDEHLMVVLRAIGAHSLRARMVAEPVGYRWSSFQTELTAVRRSLTSGRPLGSAMWVEGMAERPGINLDPRPRPAPKESSNRRHQSFGLTTRKTASRRRVRISGPMFYLF